MMRNVPNLPQYLSSGLHGKHAVTSDESAIDTSIQEQSIMSAKYEPLELHLRALPSTTATVSMTFKEIESIIGATLPRSAYQYREWWSNQKDTSNRPQAKSWIGAGFTVDTVHQK